MFRHFLMTLISVPQSINLQSTGSQLVGLQPPAYKGKCADASVTLVPFFNAIWVDAGTKVALDIVCECVTWRNSITLATRAIKGFMFKLLRC